MLKKILKYVAIIFLLLVISLFALPFLFQSKLTEMVKTEINKQVNARIDFGAISISFFKSFPKVNLSVENVQVKGIKNFEDIPLFSAKNVGLNLDLMSVIRGDNPLIIKSISIENADINALVLRDSAANYRITKPEKAKKEPSNLKLELEKYSLTNSNIVYENRLNGVKAELMGVNHTGKGSLGNDIYDLVTKTTINDFNFSFGGIQYLNKANADFDVTVSADMPKLKFTLKENTLKLNSLSAKMDGFFQLVGEGYNLDLSINTPTNEFKDLLSLVPSAYSKNFKDVKANGNFTFKGLIKGTYDGLKPIYPMFSFDLNVPKADFKYPNLPLGVSDISANMNVTFAGGNNLDYLVTDVSKLKVKIGTNPFEAKFKLKTPISDPDLDAQAKGVINLKEISQAFPLPNVESMSGILNSDIDIRATMSQINNKQYEKIVMRGDLTMTDMAYKSKDKPLIFVNSMAMNFTPNNVLLKNFSGKLGKSDIQCSGKIDNLLAYFSSKNTMTGNITMRSNLIDANEWIAKKTENDATPKAVAKDKEVEKPFNKFQFEIDGKVQQINYDKFILKNSELNGNFSPNLVTLKTFKSQLGESDMSMSGELKNIYNYFYNNELLDGKINFSSNNLDMNQFMSPAPSSSTNGKTPPPPTGTIPVPKNLDVTINANISKLKYTNMDLQNMKGNLIVKDEVVKIDGFKANSLGGIIGMNGSYSSKNPAKPGFDMDMDLQQIGFQPAFVTFNSVQKLAPIAQFIEGKFNTTMKFTGVMGQNMLPDLTTLTASGFLQTLNGLVKNFKPLEDVGNKLNVSQLKTLELKDTKNYFEIANGAVILKQFDYQMKDIALKIGGSHSLTNDMNYSIQSKIPRKLIGSNSVGAAAMTGLDALTKEGSKLGIDVNVGEFVNVLFNIGGNVTNPKISMKLLGTEGKSVGEQAMNQGKDAAKKAVDSLKTRANQEVGKIKEQANKAVDSVKTVVTQKVDDAKEKAKQQAEELRKKAEAEAKKQIDDAKKKLNDLNPFKRGG